MLKKKKGTSGNAAQYLTRSQALRRLQLRLGEFRRLCILKGIHPRDPRKKSKGGDKTYYHVKDIQYLQHEPLLKTVRDLAAHQRRVRRALAKTGAEAAERVRTQAPRFRLDALVRERYPRFGDALRDIDDPLSLTHLFAVLPAEAAVEIPAGRVARARAQALEWQAWVARTHSLRKVFVSVKGIYLQAEVAGAEVTWLVPHNTAQIVPADVDFRIMLTFLEFYQSLLGFVLFKLYRDWHLAYPPVAHRDVDADNKVADDLKAEAAALPAGKARRARAFRAAAKELGPGSGPADDSLGVVLANLRDIQTGSAFGLGLERDAAEAAESARTLARAAAAASEKTAQLEAAIRAERPRADSEGGESAEDEGESSADEDAASDADEDAASDAASDAADEDAASDGDDEDTVPTPSAPAPLSRPVPTPSAEAEECARLFRGLTFYLAREVPRELLLLVIRSFGGEACWDGEGSPLDPADDRVTHAVVDRPKGAHTRLMREHVQPQWVFDSVNHRVLAPVELYAPGLVPPPHLSPFVDAEEEGYVPEYGQQLAALRAAARGARGDAEAAAAAAAAALDVDAGTRDERETARALEAAHAAELRVELDGRETDGEASEDEGSDDDRLRAAGAPAEAATKGKLTAEEAAAAASTLEGKAVAPSESRDAGLDVSMTKKNRKIYQSIMKAASEKRKRVDTLTRRANERKAKRPGQA